MNLKNKEQAKRQTEMLVSLRKQHGKRVKEAQELLRVQQQLRKTLRSAMHNAPRSLPQLAQETGISAHEVLWHIAAMKKYGLVVETGIDTDGEYYLYRLSKEANELPR